MRVDNVDQNKGIGYIKFNTDTEIDLIAESMDRLIQKQQKLVDNTKKRDIDEVKKLERFKQSKDSVVEKPRQNKIRLQKLKDKVKSKHKERNNNNNNNNNNNKNDNKIGIGKEEDIEDTEEFKNMAKVLDNAEAGSGLREDSEVTHRNIHVLVNALNEHIWDMEKDGLYKKTRRNEQKYEKLKQMLDNAQEQKAKFERVRQKPKGYGRLRK
jgi:hypothetical protein